MATHIQKGKVWESLFVYFVYFLFILLLLPGATYWFWKRCVRGLCCPAHQSDLILQTGLPDPFVKGKNSHIVLILLSAGMKAA